MKKYDVHGMVPVVATITVEAENGEEAIEIAAKKFKGVHDYAGNGWWSKPALDDLQKMSCADCKWKGKIHQKCSCCIRNRGMKDNYED